MSLPDSVLVTKQVPCFLIRLYLSNSYTLTHETGQSLLARPRVVATPLPGPRQHPSPNTNNPTLVISPSVTPSQTSFLSLPPRCKPANHPNPHRLANKPLCTTIPTSMRHPTVEGGGKPRNRRQHLVRHVLGLELDSMGVFAVYCIARLGRT